MTTLGEPETMSAAPIRITAAQGIVDFYDAFSASDFETMHRMMHPDCTLDFPGSSFPNRTQGREAIIGLFQGVQAAMNSTLRFHNKWALFNGEQVAVHWFTTGQPAHGGRYMNRGVAWYRLEDGLIREFQDFFDTEIIAAFWPGGAPCTDFAKAEALVQRLCAYATPEALARLNSFAA
jgi:ketosteroid isomerase-like protein